MDVFGWIAAGSLIFCFVVMPLIIIVGGYVLAGRGYEPERRDDRRGNYRGRYRTSGDVLDSLIGIGGRPPRRTDRDR